jgi:hypothetical protein
MQGNTHLHSRYRPHTTASTARSTGNRHYNVCEHVGLDTNQSPGTRACITPTSWGDGPLKDPWVRESAAGRDPVYAIPVLTYQ